MPLLRKSLRTRAVVSGGVGILLCLGGIFGVYVVRGAARDAATDGVRAADSLVGALQEGVRSTRRLTRRLRADLETRIAEAAVPEIAAEIEGLRGFLRTIGASAASAAALVDALGPVLDSGDVSTRLAEVASEIGCVSVELAEIRLLGENREEARVSLVGVGTLLDDVESKLTATRAELARLEDRVHGVIGNASLASAALLLWMAVGQVCLFRAGKGGQPRMSSRAASRI